MIKAQSLIIIFFVLVAINVSAQQQYTGYRASKYIGANGTFFNPANIVASQYKWDVNLFGLNAGVGNSNNKFHLKDITRIIKNVDSLLYSSNGNNKLSAMANIDVLGPSVMMKLNNKSSFAITTRVRSIANVFNIDSRFINSIQQQVSTGNYPYTLESNNNQGTRINAWSEIGATYGRVLFNNYTHLLKMGLTLKYLRGTGNAYVNINKLKGTLDTDATGDYITNATGAIATSSVVDFQNVSFTDLLKSTGSGFGSDIGLIYQYSPNEIIYGENDYKLKIGLAVLDFGSIKYKNDPLYYSNYNMNIPAGNKLYLSDFNGKNIDEIKAKLNGDSRFQKYTANTATVSLPITLQGDLDYNIAKNVYTNIAVQFNLSDTKKVQNPYYQNNITLTPRFETKNFGVYLPLNYNSLTNFNAGLSLRGGPFFIGSGSILSLAFGQSKLLDFHMGLRLGKLQ